MIEDLLSHPWFERMWTLQELLLASHATLICGNQAIGWNSFCHAFDLLEGQFPASSKGMNNFANCFHAHSVFREMLGDSLTTDDDDNDDNASSSNSSSSSNRSLAMMIHHARIRHATYPKDKVFAMYGLSVKIGKPMPQPDYTLPISALYSAATLAIMQHDQTLWPLDNIWSENRDLHLLLPSWAPDWSDDHRWYDDLIAELGGIPTDSEVEREMISDWDGSLREQNPSGVLLVSPDHRQLTLSGQLIGVVNEVYDDSERQLAQGLVTGANRASVEYERAMRKHGAEQVRFFRRLFAIFGSGRGIKSPALAQAFSRLLYAYSPNSPEPAFKVGFQCLQGLLMATEAALLSIEARQHLLASARKKLLQLPSDNQKHPKVLEFIESDIDGALDILLSTHINGVEYYGSNVSDDSHSSPLDPYNITIAMGIYKHIRGLSINKSVFVINGNRLMIGYADGRVCAGDVLVKFHGALSHSVLRPSSGDHQQQQYQIHSSATIELIDDESSIMEESASSQFVLI